MTIELAVEKIIPGLQAIYGDLIDGTIRPSLCSGQRRTATGGAAREEDPVIRDRSRLLFDYGHGDLNSFVMQRWSDIVQRIQPRRKMRSSMN